MGEERAIHYDQVISLKKLLNMLTVDISTTITKLLPILRFELGEAIFVDGGLQLHLIIHLYMAKFFK